MNQTLTALPKIRVGHYTDLEAQTGCTVVLAPQGGFLCSVSTRGSAPGTRETDLLQPTASEHPCHGIVLSGGSAFGLAACHGAVEYLDQKGWGIPTLAATVPVVPGAVIYDLALGSPTVRPGTMEGRAACEAASSDPVPQGCVGAGTGASAGKFLGMEMATKTGLGSATFHGKDGLIVSALVVTNPVGNVLDPSNGQIIAGARGPQGYVPFSSIQTEPLMENTCIGVVATNAVVTRTELKKLADLAHDGLARSVFPTHTLYDGDAFFSLTTQDGPDGVSIIDLGAQVTQVVSQAITNSVTLAQTLGTLPASKDFNP